MDDYRDEHGHPDDGEAVTSHDLSAVAGAAASVWTEYPPTPWWYYPGFGVAGAMLAMALGGVAYESPGFVVLGPLSFGLIMALVLWYTHKWGNWPAQPWPQPPEFRRATYAYVAGCGLLLAATVGLFLVLGLVPVTVLVFVVTWLGLTVYERHYETAARATKERLSSMEVAAGVRLEGGAAVPQAAEHLAVVAVLAGSAGCDAAFLRKSLATNDDELFELLCPLLSAGHLRVSECWGRSWYALTAAGKKSAKPLTDVIEGIVRDA